MSSTCSSTGEWVSLVGTREEWGSVAADEVRHADRVRSRRVLHVSTSVDFILGTGESHRKDLSEKVRKGYMFKR